MANDDYVAVSVKLVDIFAAFYVTERSDYLANGITTTTMALSNMMTIVTTTEPRKPTTWWSFGEPFSNNMWLCLFFVMVFQGFCQAAIIKRRRNTAGDDDDDDDDDLSKPSSDMHIRITITITNDSCVFFTTYMHNRSRGLRGA